MRLELIMKLKLTRFMATTRTNHSLTISRVRLLNALKARLNVPIGVKNARLTARLSGTCPIDVDRKFSFVNELFIVTN